jgi:hypothetical protein
MWLGKLTRCVFDFIAVPSFFEGTGLPISNMRHVRARLGKPTCYVPDLTAVSLPN